MKGIKDIKWNMNKSDKEWMKSLKDISDYSFTFNISDQKVVDKNLKKLYGFVDPEIEKVIFNPPATIVLWSDHTKTIVKCMENDIYSPEAGLALCICKKFLGRDFKKTFRKWIPCGRPEKPEADIPKMDKNLEAEHAKTRLRSLFEAFDRMCADAHDFTGENDIPEVRL